jgi:L-malate glycosyltransferase
MKILILPSWYINSYNSILGSFFKEQAEALVKYGNNVGLIAIQEISIIDIFKQKKLDISKKVFTENGVNTFSIQYPAIPKLHKIRNKIKLELFKKIIQEYVNKYGLPDIVHLHSFMAGELAIWIKEKYKIPYIVTEHYSGFSRNLISKKDLLRAEIFFYNSSYNIAVSSKFAILLNKQFKQNFTSIPNIVNIDFFSVKEKKTDKEFTFINIASLDKNKNQSMLINSFVKVFKDNEDVKLTIVGEGPDYDNLNNLIIKLDMTKRIKLYGRANREEVKELLQSSDAFVLSSQYETFGVVVIEAMACGLPVVATKCSGPEDIIRNDSIGILSDIDENSLSSSLVTLYNNIDTYDANYIHQYAKDNFSEEVVCLKLNDIYKKIILEIKQNAIPLSK